MVLGLVSILEKERRWTQLAIYPLVMQFLDLFARIND